MKSELEQRRIMRKPNVSQVPSELLDKLGVIADKAVKAGTQVRILAFMVVDPEGDNECMELVRYWFEGQIDLLGWVQVATETMTRDLYASVETSE